MEFSSDAQTYLSRLPFPGNIRELKNLVERTILVSGKTLLDAADFEVHCVDTSSSKSTIPSSLEGLTLDELEKQTILRSLEAHGGNLSHVATALGISRAALYRRLEKYGIPIDK
ncbi:MAG: helix-turn-helix domain-containing protein [Parabacteroides distasonis]